MFLLRVGNRPFKRGQLVVRLGEIDFRLRRRRADLAGDVEVVTVLGASRYRNAL